MAKTKTLDYRTQANWKRQLATSRKTSWQVKYPVRGWKSVPPCEAVELGLFIGTYSIRLGQGSFYNHILRGIQL